MMLGSMKLMRRTPWDLAVIFPVGEGQSYSSVIPYFVLQRGEATFGHAPFLVRGAYRAKGAQEGYQQAYAGF